MTERSIPHLRDIFGFHGNWANSRDDVTDQLKGLRLEKESPTSKKDHDSAISSIGSTSEDEVPPTSSSKKKKQRSRRENAKTLTERDVKHLERHLSMKKTIRKKIMRDLQQAFVEDPNEFRVEDISHEKLKAEINIQSLSFGPQAQKRAAPEPSFLDMLRGGGRGENDDGDSGHGSPTRELSAERGGAPDPELDQEDLAARKTSFWRRFTIKGRNKR